MADQVFDLTQTGQQVQDIINDASKVKDAGAQTTLTTESILLKDINGNYHKILKSSFTEAIRNTLADLLVNNDKGTTISRIAAIASNDFGSITPVNLASVLGGTVSGVTWGKLLSVIPGIDDGIGLFYESGIYVGGYYTTDYTDSMIVIAVSQNRGTYYPPVILKDSESGYIYNTIGTFLVRTPQEGKTYKYFRCGIV